MADSNNRLLSALAGMQLLTLGILVTMLLNQPSENSAAVVSHTNPGNSPAAEHASAYSAQSGSVTAELKTALREIIRDELAALPASTGAAKDDANFQTDVRLSESELQEQETASTVAATIIQQATSAGIWTRADTEALMPHIGRISEQQRLALIEQLYGAINRQEMDIQDFPPL